MGMTSSSSSPLWFRWCSRFVLRAGRGWATLAFTLAVALLAAAAAQAIAMALGRPHPGEAGLSAGLCALIVTPLIAAFVTRLVVELAQARGELSAQAHRDELTGVHNRRHFMELAEREWARARRYDTSAALLLIDADHFKRVNDRHGHLCGDALLREITRLTAESLRLPDMLARFGGEELIVFLPHTDPLGALDVAERIRERVAQLRMSWQGGEVQTTVSIGVASLDATHASIDALIHDADAALFAAKEAGRNCVRAAPIQPRREAQRMTSPR